MRASLLFLTTSLLIGCGSSDAAAGAPAVTESPAPTCHDVEQLAAEVKTASVVGEPPSDGARATTLRAGIYKCVDRRFYYQPGSLQEASGSSQWTIAVADNRVYENLSGERATYDWRIDTSGALQLRPRCNDPTQADFSFVMDIEDGFRWYQRRDSNSPTYVITFQRVTN